MTWTPTALVLFIEHRRCDTCHAVTAVASPRTVVKLTNNRDNNRYERLLYLFEPQELESLPRLKHITTSSSAVCLRCFTERPGLPPTSRPHIDLRIHGGNFERTVVAPKATPEPTPHIFNLEEFQ